MLRIVYLSPPLRLALLAASKDNCTAGGLLPHLTATVWVSGDFCSDDICPHEVIKHESAEAT